MEEYEVIRENIAKTAKVLEHKEEGIADLKKAVREAGAKLSEAQIAQQLQQKMQRAKNELAWAHVAAKQAVRSVLLLRCGFSHPIRSSKSSWMRLATPNEESPKF